MVKSVPPLAINRPAYITYTGEVTNKKKAIAMSLQYSKCLCLRERECKRESPSQLSSVDLIPCQTNHQKELHTYHSDLCVLVLIPDDKTKNWQYKI